MVYRVRHHGSSYTEFTTLSKARKMYVGFLHRGNESCRDGLALLAHRTEQEPGVVIAECAK